MTGKFILPILAVFAAGVFCGCSSTKEALRADPAPLTDFLPEHDKIATIQNADCPVQRFWKDSSVKWSDYDKIIIMKVNTEYLLKQSWWGSMNSRNVIQSPEKDCEMIARYTESAFVQAITKDPQKRFNIVSSPGKNTAYLELAIVQLVPSKPFLTAAEHTVGVFIPGTGALSMANKGSVAIEGKIIDSMSGKVICMFTDREVGDGALIDVAGLTWYRHAEIIIDRWAEGFVKISNQPGGMGAAKSKSKFKLFQW